MEYRAVHNKMGRGRKDTKINIVHCIVTDYLGKSTDVTLSLILVMILFNLAGGA